MNNREIQLPAIPVDFVLQQGEKEHTEAKRRPYSTLIRTWAEHEGKAEVGEKIVSKLNIDKESDKLKNLHPRRPLQKVTPVNAVHFSFLLFSILGCRFLPLICVMERYYTTLEAHN